MEELIAAMKGNIQPHAMTIEPATSAAATPASHQPLFKASPVQRIPHSNRSPVDFASPFTRDVLNAVVSDLLPLLPARSPSRPLIFNVHPVLPDENYRYKTLRWPETRHLWPQETVRSLLFPPIRVRYLTFLPFSIFRPNPTALHGELRASHL
jgi:hypothetical protein